MGQMKYGGGSLETDHCDKDEGECDDDSPLSSSSSASLFRYRFKRTKLRELTNLHDYRSVVLGFSSSLSKIAKFAERSPSSPRSQNLPEIFEFAGDCSPELPELLNIISRSGREI
ncbi:Uncharacterized protein Rs2_04689 [Raphanus sativus]|nr:Uncharacterized protein Rs2_04689 [Raphanus sativus]